MERVTGDGEGVTILVRAVGTSAKCPSCGRSSHGVHSRYPRTVSDLPLCGAPVALRVRARPFFCDDLSCERQIFCERLREVAAHARKTGRLEAALLSIAFGLGGEAGRFATILTHAIGPTLCVEVSPAGPEKAYGDGAPPSGRGARGRSGALAVGPADCGRPGEREIDGPRDVALAPGSTTASGTSPRLGK